MVQRLTYRRRHSYATRSNVVKKVKTPGGVLKWHYVTKNANSVKCGDCGKPLQGMPAVRPKANRQLKKIQRKVTRAYGGSRCANCVRARIVRAFLIEEQKIVKQVVRSRQKQLAQKRN